MNNCDLHPPLDIHFLLCYSIHTILFWRKCAGNELTTNN